LGYLCVRKHPKMPYTLEVCLPIRNKKPFKMTSTTTQAPDSRAQLIGTPYEPQTPDLWELLQQGRRQNPTGLAFAALHHDEDYLEISKLFPSISTEWKNLEWTYDQLSNAAEALGSTLGSLAAAPSAIATFFYPTADWALLFWTAAKMGAPFAPLDPKMLGREEDVRIVLDLLRPDVVLVHDDDAAALADEALSSIGFEPKLKIMSFASRGSRVGWLCMLDLLRQPRQADGVESTLPENPLSGDRIGRILFTGGSTGAPKACPHSILNLCAESEQYATLRDLGPASQTLIQSPCNHIMAYAGALLTWRAGGAVVLPGASFNARASLEAIEQYHVTYLPVHYSMSDALLADAAFHKHKVASVKYLQIGGALIGADLLARYHSEFADIKIFPFWGMTEGMYTTANGLANTATLREGVLAVGLVQPGGRVRVVDPDTGTVCRRGEVGELHIGGATVIKSYMHGASPASFYSDRYGQWFKSGDQGLIDELGQVHMMGRYKDVIKRGGENLYPQLAEHRLLSKTGIRVSA
jgi:acyl-CoA synthetase (AMP-forming)/AMP-acid ligase II